VHLARSGCIVAGIDVNANFIARARMRFRRERLKGAFSVLDPRHLRFRGDFDGAYNWGGSFGYFSDEENLEVLRGMALALRPGGRLLIDQVNRQYLLRHFRSASVAGVVTVRTRWNAGLQRVESRWTVTRDGRQIRCLSTIRLYTPVQLRRLLRQAGLAWDRGYGGPNGSRYRPSSRRLIVVARKPG
jgi:SAM-dependent methyltransferase